MPGVYLAHPFLRGKCFFGSPREGLRSPPRRLWDEIAGSRPHHRGVAAVDETVEVQIGAEGGGVRRLAGAVARLESVARVHRTVAVGISDERLHGYG